MLMQAGKRQRVDGHLHSKPQTTFTLGTLSGRALVLSITEKMYLKKVTVYALSLRKRENQT